jgi:hypothetical protein
VSGVRSSWLIVGRAQRFGLARFGEEPIVLEHLRDEAGDRLGQPHVVRAERVGQRARQREHRDGATAHPQRHEHGRARLLVRTDRHVARIREEIAHNERCLAGHRRAEQSLAEPEARRRMRLRERARSQAVERPVLAELVVRDEDGRAIEAQHIAAGPKDRRHDRIRRRDPRDDPHDLRERHVLRHAPLQLGDESFALVAELPELAEPAIEQERGQPEHRQDEDRPLRRCREPERRRPERGNAEIAERRDRGGAPGADRAEPERAGDDDDHRDEIGHPPRVAREQEHRDDQDAEVAGEGDRRDPAVLLEGRRAP